MAIPFKYKDASGNIQTINFDPTYIPEMTFATDATACSVKFVGPTDSTTVEIIGGRPSRGLKDE